MSEIKTEIKQNPDGSYTITDAHSTADVVRWLLTQDSKETILYLLGDTPQRKPLTEQEIGAILEDINAFGTRLYTFARAIEAAHGIAGEKPNAA
jgi:hypothetical protein